MDPCLLKVQVRWPQTTKWKKRMENRVTRSKRVDEILSLSHVTVKRGPYV